jgi:thiamine-phosphate pyrophosphorylase
MPLPKIYPITDTKLSGISHLEQVKALLAGGARMIQIRDKTLASRGLFGAIEECQILCREFGAKLIVNDRVDIAMALGGDGVHLGQDDLPPAEARKLLGPGAVIGFSTHSVEQAIEAIELPVDYIAAGPIFPTRSKTDPEPVIGREGLGKIREAIGDFPLVGIGGINLDNCRDVFSAGADSVAMISALVSQPSRITTQMRKASEIASNWSDC